jgi:uncharacterized membrane protein YphA (DoxX/SURF4 family)
MAAFMAEKMAHAECRLSKTLNLLARLGQHCMHRSLKFDRMETMDWPYRICRFTLGSIFIYAGGTKLLEPEIFAVLIEAYGIVPEGLLMPVAIGLPLLEVVAGIGLLFDIRGSLALITGLLVLFIVVLGYGIWMGLDVDCGCFGPEDPEAEAFHGLRLSLFRDLVMMAGVIFLYGWRRYRAIRPVDVKVMVNQLFSKRRKEDAYG